MSVATTCHIFHQTNIAGSKQLLGTVAGSNLYFSVQMDDQPTFWQRVEVHLPAPVKLSDLYLAEIGQCTQFGMLLQTHFLDMAFSIPSRENSIQSHSTPLYNTARFSNSSSCRPNQIPQATEGIVRRLS